MQNHNYAVDPESLPDGVEVTHVNLNDGSCAGLASSKMKLMSLQYHPEASPGPHDSDPGKLILTRSSLSLYTTNLGQFVFSCIFLPLLSTICVNDKYNLENNDVTWPINSTKENF